MSIKGVAFDLDGTLVDSAADIARAVNLLLAAHALPPQAVDFVEQFIGGGTRELVAGVYGGMGVDVPVERLDRDVATYIEHQSSAPVVYSRVYADAVDALGELRSLGVSIGICTNKAERVAHQVLAALGMDGLVDAVVGGNSLTVRKPHPEHLLATLRAMGTAPENAVFVGDTEIDLQCAERAGVTCWLVDWSKLADDASSGPRRMRVFRELVHAVRDQ